MWDGRKRGARQPAKRWRQRRDVCTLGPTLVNNSELIAVALCKTIFATARMDMLNLGCSSRRILAELEFQHKDQSTRNPFSTHSMLRPKHVANIVSTLSAYIHCYLSCSCAPHVAGSSKPCTDQ